MGCLIEETNEDFSMIQWKIFITWFGLYAFSALRRKNEGAFKKNIVYVIELALKFSPLPLSVQRKKLRDAEALYQQVRRCMENGQTRLLELTCEQVEDKKLTVLGGEILAVQVYEKTAASGGIKRPGFSFDSWFYGN